MNKLKTKSRRLKHGIKRNALYSLFLLIVLITSCKLSGKEEKSSNKQSSEGNIESNSDTDYNSVKSVVQNWNKTHQDYNFTAMQKIYSDKVLYYGKEMTNQDIVFAKQSFIKKNIDFTQTILGDLNIENIGEHRMKVSFIKQASFGGKRNEYPSYLDLQKFESEWKICTESDDITDKNLAKSQNLKTYGNNKRNAQRNVMDDIIPFHRQIYSIKFLVYNSYPVIDFTSSGVSWFTIWVILSCSVLVDSKNFMATLSFIHCQTFSAGLSSGA